MPPQICACYEEDETWSNGLRFRDLKWSKLRALEGQFRGDSRVDSPLGNTGPEGLKVVCAREEEGESPAAEPHP